MTRPPFLFKYRSLGDTTRAWVERTFTHSELYFASPHEFNDPFESRFLLSLEGTPDARIKKIAGLLLSLDSGLTHDDAVANASDLLIRLSTKPDDLKDWVEKHIVDHLRSRLAILTLAERGTDVLMWSHYADSHRGICLQFDTSACHTFLASAKVAYSDSVPTLNWVTDDDETVFRTVALTKASHWQYEDEWRTIDRKRGAGVRHYSRDALAGVIFGLETPPADRQLVRDWCKGRSRAVKFYKTVLDHGLYSLSVVPT